MDAPTPDNSGFWSAAGIFFTALFGWLGKLAWDKRPKASASVSHRDLEDLKRLLLEDQADRAEFRGRIEASMVTKDDLHKEVSAFRDHSDAQASKLHERLDAHVMAYHKT
jgi:hypothetical protein